MDRKSHYELRQHHGNPAKRLLNKTKPMKYSLATIGGKLKDGIKLRRSDVFIPSQNMDELNLALLQMRSKAPGKEYVLFNDIIWYFPSGAQGSEGATPSIYKNEDLVDDDI